MSTSAHDPAALVPCAWRHAGLFVFCLIFAGCATRRPPPPPAPQPVVPAVAETHLSRQLQGVVAAHPDISGFYLLHSGMDAFTARVLLADAAEKSIDLQYFIVRNDLTTRVLFDHLLRAADRGVRIRILLDDIHTGSRALGLDKLDAHYNIRIRVFKPFRHRGMGIFTLPLHVLLKPVQASQRMHNKMFVVDEKAGIIGGRNLADSYFDAGPDDNFQDIDLWAIGPVVSQLTTCFNSYWESAWTVPMESVKFLRPSSAAVTQFRTALAQTVREAADSPYVKRLRDSDLLQRLESGRIPLIWAKAELFYDAPAKAAGGTPPNPSRPPPLLHPFAEQTRSEMVFISPYLIPGRNGMELFAGLRQRQVRIRILTNSLLATDIGMAHAGYASYRKELLRMGVELHEFKTTANPAKSNAKRIFGSSSRASLHAKAYVFDNEVVIIGSFNLDPRSMYLNTELGLVVYSPELARQVLDFYGDATALRNSYRVELAPPTDGRSERLVWITRNAAGQEVRLDKEEGAGLMMRAAIALLSILPLEGLL